jgi:pilus assembly protein Flp/PilA
MLAYFRALLRSAIKDEKGQDLAEYALLIALIAIVVILAVTLLGTQIQTIFQKIAGNLTLGG